MISQDPTVFVVDDDQQARDSVCALVRSMGINTQSFSSAEEFLAAYQVGRAGCLVTDVRMLGMSGVELQQELIRSNIFLPVIVMTAFARTRLTVEVVQKGAVTVLEKPYDEDDLWNAIRHALAIDASKRPEHERRNRIRQKIASLSDKERAVLDRMMAGKPNKIIARELDVSVRTVENRRRDIFGSLDATSVAEVVRMVIEAEAIGITSG